MHEKINLLKILKLVLQRKNRQIAAEQPDRQPDLQHEKMIKAVVVNIEKRNRKSRQAPKPTAVSRPKKIPQIIGRIAGYEEVHRPP